VIELLGKESDDKAGTLLLYASELLKAAWIVPRYGQEIGCTLSNTLREIGWIDLLIGNFKPKDRGLSVPCARLLEQILIPKNCNYIVEKGQEYLENVVKVRLSNKDFISEINKNAMFLSHSGLF
jgi:hypothetical protein